ncbi:hypothetical protein SLE2022_253040 [Rubroshorea leprosula]
MVDNGEDLALPRQRQLLLLLPLLELCFRGEPGSINTSPQLRQSTKTEVYPGRKQCSNRSIIGCIGIHEETSILQLG